MKKSSRKLFNSAPVTTYLIQPYNLTNNWLQQAMDQLSFTKILKLSKFRKQKGDGLFQVMFALIIWPLLEVRSISNFCGKLISVFIKCGKSLLYVLQKRQDLPWRRLRISLAKKGLPQERYRKRTRYGLYIRRHPEVSMRKKG